ncbi:MAG TPA: hypothetical protein PK771_04645 [Spirochaetota bacterium]|nr:hypothetical protein [Spirochaetota bacterium]
MFYSQMLPEKILLKLQELNVVKSSEKIVAFYDNSLFLSANKGLLCTESEIKVYKGKKIETYNLSDVKDILFREIDKEAYIFKMILVTKDNKEFDVTPSSIPNDEMKLLIDVINMSRKRK